MNASDRIRLQHMLDVAREAISFASGKTRESLDDDRMLSLALIKDIEIIGEAASRVTEEIQQAHSHIPWHAIIGMRNWLIHVYFDIDLDLVWDTITSDLPALVTQLEQILASDKQSG